VVRWEGAWGERGLSLLRGKCAEGLMVFRAKVGGCMYAVRKVLTDEKGWVGTTGWVGCGHAVNTSEKTSFGQAGPWEETVPQGGHAGGRANL